MDPRAPQSCFYHPHPFPSLRVNVLLHSVIDNRAGWLLHVGHVSPQEKVQTITCASRHEKIIPLLHMDQLDILAKMLQCPDVIVMPSPEQAVRKQMRLVDLIPQLQAELFGHELQGWDILLRQPSAALFHVLVYLLLHQQRQEGVMPDVLTQEAPQRAQLLIAIFLPHRVVHHGRG